MGYQLQGYTNKEEVAEASKKAAKILGKSIANFIGDTVEEKVEVMGLLNDEETPNIWEIIAELTSNGIPLERIVEKLEILMEGEVCSE